MLIKIDYEKCSNCGNCVSICPVNAIYKEDVVKIDNSRCIKCKTCVLSCSLKAIMIK